MTQDMLPYLPTVLIAICAATFLLCALHDVAARTVPNGASVIIALGGLALRLLDGTLPMALGLALAALLVGKFCWTRGWMGGGDVKLIAAGALAVPPGQFLSFITVMSVAGAILALPYLAGRTLRPRIESPRPQALAARVLRAERWRLRRGGPLPYACAIAAGGLSALF